MTETPFTGHSTTPTSKHDTSTAHSWQSDAPVQNQQSGHTAAANAQHAKGNAMTDIDKINEAISAILKQTQELAAMVGIEDEPSA